MQFEGSHEGATVALLQPNEVRTPVKMNFIDTGSWLVAEPIVKYSALTFGQSDEFFETEVQLVPQGIRNVIIPSYSVTYVNAPGGSRVLEEGKDYTVSGFKNNSKTFVFTNGLFTNVATPELTIRGNVQNPSVESFAGAMDNFAVEHEKHANCFFSKEFAVTGTFPLVDSTYVECQIQLFNWGNDSAKLDDVAQFEVQL
ncbi:MAG: hypothetical protein MJ200_02630 [Mycoplasmoidaceae bacterium]|nr:hypothetical protein [Mycoplasmoidaceae bacterium]